MCGIAAYEIMVDNNDNIADFLEGVKGKEKEKYLIDSKEPEQAV